MLVKIPPSEVRLGMYVAGFGGSWFEHPFWRPKFVIENKRDLDKVRHSSVPYVLIDETLGASVEQEPAACQADADIAAQEQREHPLRRVRKARRPAFQMTKEAIAHRRASQLVNRTKQQMRRIFTDLQMGWALDRADVDGVLDNIVQSVGEDAHALLNVLRIKTKDDYTFLHSAAVCTLMLCVARHRGMDEAETRDLGLAGLLHDVGKIGIPDEVLNKPARLTDPEFSIVKNHPEHGHKLLASAGDIAATALDVCLHHHEKIDGTGYPFGLSAENISFAARLGAVCDIFDALTSQRAYKDAWSPQQALTKMWAWEGHLDHAVMAELMVALNLFAEGLLVKLSNDRLAITLHNDPPGKAAPVVQFFAVEAGEMVAPQKIIIPNDGKGVRVLSVEEPGAWGFDDWDAVRSRVVDSLGA